jgi:carboxyl-terminal processing protease
MAQALDVPKRRPSRVPMILSVVAAAMIAFAGGMVVDHLAVAQQTQAPLKDFTVYEQALQDIRDHYVGRSQVTDQQLLYGSISGMVDSLGDTNHTRFLTPDEYQQMTSQLSGKVAGIGILVSQTNGELIVSRVISGSPAEKAGMKAGDNITAVDGTSVTGMNFDQLAAKIRGDVGTKVTVTVIHAGSTTPVDLTMVRATVSRPLVDWGMVPGTHVADVALFEFAAGAADQIHQATAAATKAGATAIVLDLRGNPGGLASEARTVASEFLSSGVVYIDEDGSGNRTEVKVDTSRSSTALPMVVLVDHDTASAAEIVAGAVQDSHRAKVVGQTTVGTGTVLQPYVLSDGSVVLLGVADWLTPSGNRIFGKGITPDETVALPTAGQPIDPISLSTMTAAQLQSSSDAQLLAAVKDLTK